MHFIYIGMKMVEMAEFISCAPGNLEIRCECMTRVFMKNEHDCERNFTG